MNQIIVVSLVMALLISGCGTTNLVTPKQSGQKVVSLQPMLDNPTRNEMTHAGFIAEPMDICLGVSSQISF